MRKLLFIAIVLMSSDAFAQQTIYVPPDKELWEAMVRALGDVPATLTAHQQIQNILSSVQRTAQEKEQKKDGGQK